MKLHHSIFNIYVAISDINSLLRDPTRPCGPVKEFYAHELSYRFTMLNSANTITVFYDHDENLNSN